MMGNFIGIFDKIRSCFLISQFIINLKQEKYGYITKFQYKYYALNQYDASGNLIKYNSNNPNFVKRDTSNSAVWWWLRSPDYNSSDRFGSVNYYGYADTYNATATGGSVAPGFAI